MINFGSFSQTPATSTENFNAGPSSQNNVASNANIYDPGQVIEYLMKKGYTRTEQVLRQESAHVDKEGRPIFDRPEEYGNEKYIKGFELLASWIEQNLDIYKVSQTSFSYFTILF
jgi:transcription initiation factor TFIID subunit 5